MKHRLTLLALVALGLAAFGCDPAPKDEPTTPPTSTQPEKPATPEKAPTPTTP